MFTIAKTFGFAASHQLHGLPADHKCARVHGHNYQVTAELAGPLDGTGFVVDYGDLQWFRAYIDQQFDHRHLNDHPAFVDTNPTAEHLALHLYEQLHQRYGDIATAVRVHETPNTWAEYRRPA